MNGLHFPGRVGDGCKIRGSVCAFRFYLPHHLDIFDGLVRVCELIYYSFGIHGRKGITLGENKICVIELFSCVMMYVDSGISPVQ